MELCKLSRLLIGLAVTLMLMEPGGEAGEEGHYSKRRFMTDHNGGTIQLTERAELLSLARNGGPFPAKWRSSVTVRAPKGHVVRVQFLNVRPPSIPGICNQRMFLFDGHDTLFSRMIHEAMRPLCGDSAPFNDFISSGQPMTLQFVSDGLALPNEHGFTASLTPIRLLGCLESDFHCNNGYCINTYLRCDGYNNCGDRSDELGCFASKISGSITTAMTTLSYLEWTIITLGCVGVAILIIMLIWYIVSDRAKDDYQQIDSPGKEKWNPNYYQ
ncbi:uncharacterized protein LOC135496307 isoform X2 [Lineus longissimus]|uniref:uncharacterized protein LOC135496307 isoform X2 n=1 Tax=Lineus longissimus TaxID=88925 RepID=UPI002B4D68EA